MERISPDGLTRTVVTREAAADVSSSPQQTHDNQGTAETLRAGTIVTLITGSPNMTVQVTYSNASGTFVRCEHFEGSKLIENGYAPESPRVVSERVEGVSRDGPERGCDPAGTG